MIADSTAAVETGLLLDQTDGDDADHQEPGAADDRAGHQLEEAAGVVGPGRLGLDQVLDQALAAPADRGSGPAQQGQPGDQKDRQGDGEQDEVGVLEQGDTAPTIVAL